MIKKLWTEDWDSTFKTKINHYIDKIIHKFQLDLIKMQNYVVSKE